MIRQFCYSKDPFGLSLGGLTTVASHAFAPAIDSGRINAAWDRRLGNRPESGDSEGGQELTRVLEAWLARNFAPGRCDTARS